MYDDAALSGPSDYLFVLDWGLHWTTSGAGRPGRTPLVQAGRGIHGHDAQRLKFILGDADVRDRLARRRRLRQSRHAARVRQRHGLAEQDGTLPRMEPRRPNRTSPTATPRRATRGLVHRPAVVGTARQLPSRWASGRAVASRQRGPVDLGTAGSAGRALRPRGRSAGCRADHVRRRLLTAPPAPLPRAAVAPAPQLQAFVLAGAPDSLADLEAHAGAIGVVYPTFFECLRAGGDRRRRRRNHRLRAAHGARRDAALQLPGRLRWSTRS